MRICGTGRQTGIWPKVSIRGSLNRTPFSPHLLSCLEEMIRTTTSDYELPLFDRDNLPMTVSIGMALIALATKESQSAL